MNGPSPDGDRKLDSANDPPMPRWVKAFAIVAAVVAILIIVLLATGHGPGRHGSHLP